MKTLARRMRRTFLFLKLLFDRNVSHLRFCWQTFDTRYSIEKVFLLVNVDIKSLRVYIPGRGYVNIQATPHFNILSLNSRDEYRIYLEKNFPHCDVESEISSFLKIRDKIENNPNQVLVLLQYSRDGINILDGIHRTAILANMGVENIRGYLKFE